uniref:Uncharacterized protein n=1 Tax=Arion vulgaris TaxID=1028688 RepID=A0A0B7AYY2_9EUPU
MIVSSNAEFVMKALHLLLYLDGYFCKDLYVYMLLSAKMTNVEVMNEIKRQ